MDILRLYEDYGVDFLTEGHKHCRDGWINTECPHCSGNPGMHLGWNLEGEYFYCWRCGYHSPVKTISELLDKSSKETYAIIQNYGIVRSYIQKKPKNKKDFLLPANVTKLKPRHIKYLKMRGFNPDKLIKLYGLKGTGPLSYMQDIDYRFRILIPIYWNGEMVSFDSRDITGLKEDKYKACPIDREIRERKKILYGNQEAWDSTGIVVEGATDVWRLGENACSTSGISYTQEQVKEIAKVFKKVAVVFDDDPQAVKQGKKLVKDLQFRNVDAYQVFIKGDPGDMSNSDAKKLVKSILNKT